MGRHRNDPSDPQRNSGHVSSDVAQQIEQRLGYTGQVCARCDARNPADADTCRKCGHASLRPRKATFQDEK